jgi:hypothetical protein
MKIFKNKFIIFIPLFIVSFLILFSGGYTYWNSANPEQTCASCHEIRASVDQWQHSAHRNLQCAECHGTALSNGWHSLSEKANMVFAHVGSSPENEDLKMSEEQVLEITGRCVNCHSSEHAKWSAGRHSTTYADIFLDEEHNKMESPYWDCFRCHGMHYDGDINDLMQRPDSVGGMWKMLQAEQADVNAITCLACHKMHTDNEPIIGSEIASLNKESRNTPNNWYIRTDKRHQRADKLQMVEMVDKNGVRIKVSDDPAHKLCVQCHSPNAYHEAGTEDDRTPTGVHEGISCVACHDPHSNSAQNSCNKCHTDVSKNCKQDVRTMNTNYFNPKSKNNIHHISCTSCHAEKS